MWPFILKLNGDSASQANYTHKLPNYWGLWKIFEQKKIMSREKFKNMFSRSRRIGRYFPEIIMEDLDLPEEKILKCLAEFYSLPHVFLRNKVIAAPVINLIPKEIAQQNSVVIFKKIRNVIHVATTAPENHQVFDFIHKKTGLVPKIFITTPRDIEVALMKYNVSIREDFAKIIDQSLGEAISSNASAEKLAQFVPVIRMVNSIIDKALIKNASDIHIEPTAEKVVIRYRIDGILHKMAELPAVLLSSIVARIIILANLKIDEHIMPQDGRFQYDYNNQEIAVRVSVIPTLHGPKVAMRLLEMKQKNFTLAKLGLNKSHLATLKQEIQSSHGMILVTGPTGSGKTTTLYTILRMLNKEGVNICTIEDPIEYGLDHINQMQIKPLQGLTFAIGLRALLRQDPNIIMIGEIRDVDTASIAVHSAMTGHLVLSTLHTNSAFLAPQRISEMGVQPFLLGPVLNLAIGQRLVRKICERCKTPVRPAEKAVNGYSALLNLDQTLEKLKRSGLADKDASLDNIRFYRGKGCPDCHFTGFKGRMGIYEVLKIDEELKNIILKNPSEEAVKDYLLSRDAITMLEDGILKVFSGHTTFDEILRVTKE